jgi:hypothetical protein
VLVDEVAAGDLWAGDVARLEERQAQRVERLCSSRVASWLLRPLGLDVADAVPVTLPVGGL